MKMNCNICDKQVGFLSYFKLKDGYICYECSRKAQYDIKTKYYNMSVEQCKKDIDCSNKSAEYIKNFTKEYSQGFAYNLSKKTFYLKDKSFWEEYKFQDVETVEVIANNTSITKFNSGKAIVGGALFGVGGMIAGAILGTSKKKDILSDLSIKITFKELNLGITYIKLLKENKKNKSEMIENTKIQCDEILNIFSKLMD